MFFKLAIKSLLNRKGSVFLALVSMAISIFVLLGVEHIRNQAKTSFASTVSGVDLIVGSRTGGLNLLLYSVFHVGAPTNNIRWQTYQTLATNSQVEWAVPLSLGDSHKGYRVLGTTADYFKHFSYSSGETLTFKNGHTFNRVFEVVLGHDAAKALGYKLNQEIIVAHGLGQTSFKLHDDNPFTIVGILERTGTPVDKTIHVSLQGIEAIHRPGRHDNLSLTDSNMRPENITAVMLGLKSKIATFHVQRMINDYKQEPLTSILPGIALMELWQMLGLLENVLRLISVFVLIASLLGLSAMLLASIRERNHEIQLLRMIGASPVYLFLLIELEAMLICVLSTILGVGCLFLCLFFAGELLASQFGLYISTQIFTQSNLILLLSIITLAALIATIPAISSYKKAKGKYH